MRHRRLFSQKSLVFTVAYKIPDKHFNLQSAINLYSDIDSKFEQLLLGIITFVKDRWESQPYKFVIIQLPSFSDFSTTGG